MLDLTKDFKFEVEFKINEDNSWNIIITSEDDIADEDVINFMGNIYHLVKKRKIEEYQKKENELYKKLKWWEKIIYTLKH